jgi:hypothetical protein
MRLLFTFMLLALPAILFGQATGEISGIVWTAEGRPMAFAEVFVHNADENSHTIAFCSANGVFDVKDLKPGRYWVAAYSERAQLMSETSLKVNLPAGQNAHSDVTLGKSTATHGFFVRMVRRLDGLH